MKTSCHPCGRQWKQKQHNEHPSLLRGVAATQKDKKKDAEARNGLGILFYACR